MNGTSSFSWLWQWPEWIPTLLPGLGVALLLMLIGCAVGYTCGFLLALLTESRFAPAKWMAVVVVEVGRGIPILVLLYLIYQGLPQAGVLIDAFPSACIAFTWSAAAYSAEILRGAIVAVPRGQFDAAAALSLNPISTYASIILPQAARIAIPPLVTLTITMFHATSLASVITVTEIMQIAHQQGAMKFNYMAVFTAAGIIYLVIAVPAAIFADRLSKRFGGASAGRRSVVGRSSQVAELASV